MLATFRAFPPSASPAQTPRHVDGDRLHIAEGSVVYAARRKQKIKTLSASTGTPTTSKIKIRHVASSDINIADAQGTGLGFRGERLSTPPQNQKQGVAESTSSPPLATSHPRGAERTNSAFLPSASKDTTTRSIYDAAGRLPTTTAKIAATSANPQISDASPTNQQSSVPNPLREKSETSSKCPTPRMPPPINTEPLWRQWAPHARPKRKRSRRERSNISKGGNMSSGKKIEGRERQNQGWAPEREREEEQ